MSMSSCFDKKGFFQDITHIQITYLKMLQVIFLNILGKIINLGQTKGKTIANISAHTPSRLMDMQTCLST